MVTKRQAAAAVALVTSASIAFPLEAFTIPFPQLSSPFAAIKVTARTTTTCSARRDDRYDDSYNYDDDGGGYDDEDYDDIPPPPRRRRRSRGTPPADDLGIAESGTALNVPGPFGLRSGLRLPDSVSKALLAGIFVLGIGTGVTIESQINTDPKDLVNR